MQFFPFPARVIFLVALVHFPMSRPILAQQSERQGTKSESISRLMALIASTNKPPPAGFPKDYDYEAQEQVFWALKTLIGCSVEHVDHLIENVDSMQYCYTANKPVHLHNTTVGNVCKKILSECFAPGPPPICQEQLVAAQGWSSADYHFRLEEYWEKHKGRGLVKLQIESLERQLAVVKSISHKTASPLRDNQPFPNEAEFEEKKKVTELRLKALIKVVSISDKPIHPECTWLMEFVGRRGVKIRAVER